MPFTFDPDADPPTLPASDFLKSEKYDLECKEIEAARRPLELHRDGKFQLADKAWNALLAGNPSTLDVRRLALGVAATKDALGDDEGAYAALEKSTDESASFDVRGKALVARGILADRLGLREEAVRHYEEALSHFETRPEYTAFDWLREIASHGVESSQGAASIPIKLYDAGVPL